MNLSDSLTIGDVKLRNRVFLAPMAGISDLPFRQRAWRAGAGLVVSEMIASSELCGGNLTSNKRLEGEDLALHGIQLVGRQPTLMHAAAKIAQSRGAHLIDINMGCPAKKVTGGLGGAALMRNIPLACEVIKAVVGAVTIPVTLKMRLGWDEESINAALLAHTAEQCGISMIIVHARTRSQFYHGNADWAAVAQVREAISIPLVINGDIQSRFDAENAITQSGADAVMVGRAAFGAPWLVGEIAGNQAKIDKACFIRDHFLAMLDHYGPEVGLRQARKHINCYLQKHFAGLYTRDEQKRLLVATEPETVLRSLAAIMQSKQQTTTVH